METRAGQRRANHCTARLRVDRHSAPRHRRKPAKQEPKERSMAMRPCPFPHRKNLSMDSQSTHSEQNSTFLPVMETLPCLGDLNGAPGDPAFIFSSIHNDCSRPIVFGIRRSCHVNGFLGQIEPDVHLDQQTPACRVNQVIFMTSSMRERGREGTAATTQ